jgi:hypothetical protein
MRVETSSQLTTPCRAPISDHKTPRAPRKAISNIANVHKCLQIVDVLIKEYDTRMKNVQQFVCLFCFLLVLFIYRFSVLTNAPMMIHLHRRQIFLMNRLRVCFFCLIIVDI